VIFRRRGRFGDLVQRQLDLFAEDEAELLAELDAAERAYDAAERDDAEEAYGDVQLVVDLAAERLAEVRDAYAATLDEDAEAAYAAAFERAATKRYPRLTGLL
jgi:hypothetical protein